MRWIQILMVVGTALFVGWLFRVDHDTRLEYLLPPPCEESIESIGCTFPGGPGSDDVLFNLPNPIGPRTLPPPPDPFFALSGVLTSSATPHGGVAFLKSDPPGSDLMAWMGKGIRRAGFPEAEYSNWTLEEVGKDSATFRVGSRHVTLRIRYTDQ